MASKSKSPRKSESSSGSPTVPCSVSSESPGTLRLGEPHPSSRAALRYVCELGFARHVILLESFSSCAIDGNRMAEVCAETLRRVIHAEPVSDRYVLGLAWEIRDMESSQNVQEDTTSPAEKTPLQK